MNSLRKHNQFVSSVKSKEWKEFISERINKECFGFDDYFKDFDFSQFDGDESKAYEDAKKAVLAYKNAGIYLIFRTAYEVPDVFSSRLTPNNMHVFLFIPTNTSYVLKKLPYNWSAPKTGAEFARGFSHYFPRIKRDIVTAFDGMNEFDFDGEFVEFMSKNVADNDAYGRYLQRELLRNKKYLSSGNKHAWGADEEQVISKFAGSQKA